MNNSIDLITASLIDALPESKKPMFEYKSSNMHFWPVLRQVERNDKRTNENQGPLTDEEKQRITFHRPAVKNDDAAFEKWFDSMLPWHKRKVKVSPEEVDFSVLNKALENPEFIKLMPEKWQPKKEHVEVVKLSEYKVKRPDTVFSHDLLLL